MTNTCRFCKRGRHDYGDCPERGWARDLPTMTDDQEEAR